MRTRAWPPDGAFGSGTSTIFKFWAGLPYAVRWMAFIGDILLVPTNPGLYYDSKIRDGLWKGAPDDVDAATNRHDALAAIGSVSTSCAIGEKSGHAFDIMSVRCGETLLRVRCEICRVRFHLIAPVEVIFCW